MVRDEGACGGPGRGPQACQATPAVPGAGAWSHRPGAGRARRGADRRRFERAGRGRARAEEDSGRCSRRRRAGAGTATQGMPRAGTDSNGTLEGGGDGPGEERAWSANGWWPIRSREGGRDGPEHQRARDRPPRARAASLHPHDSPYPFGSRQIELEARRGGVDVFLDKLMPLSEMARILSEVVRRAGAATVTTSRWNCPTHCVRRESHRLAACSGRS